MNNFIRDEKGLSLIEVMVVVGLLGGLALFLMNIMEQQTKVSQTAQIEAEVNSIRAALNRMTNNKGSCDRNFQGRMKGDTINRLVYGADWQNQQAFLQTGQEFGNTGLIVQEIKMLTKAEEALGNTCPSAGMVDLKSVEGVLCLRITLQSRKKIYGAQNKIVYFPIDVRFGIPYMPMSTNISSTGDMHTICKQQKDNMGMSAGQSRMICNGEDGEIMLAGQRAATVGVCIINSPHPNPGIDVDPIMECVGLDKTDQSYLLSENEQPCP